MGKLTRRIIFGAKPFASFIFTDLARQGLFASLATTCRTTVLVSVLRHVGANAAIESCTEGVVLCVADQHAMIYRRNRRISLPSAVSYNLPCEPTGCSRHCCMIGLLRTNWLFQSRH